MDQQQPQQAALQQQQEQIPQQPPVQQKQEHEDVSEPPPAYQPPAYQPPAYQPPTNMEEPQPQPVLGVVPLTQLGDGPQWIDCPFCQRRTQTRVEIAGGGGMQVQVTPAVPMVLE
ncbi:hypothetical protein QBC45DRAFT_436258 [Copromyces sp. CBS 386.78]|nr:hypothetical protein QBC45DRAFT_436258 [Copromyces sp. CBS 386.78]